MIARNEKELSELFTHDCGEPYFELFASHQLLTFTWSCTTCYWSVCVQLSSIKANRFGKYMKWFGQTGSCVMLTHYLNGILIPVNECPYKPPKGSLLILPLWESLVPKKRKNKCK